MKATKSGGELKLKRRRRCVQSKFNPGWNNVTTAACVLPVAYITAGPSTLSNQTAASFAFNATQGACCAWPRADQLPRQQRTRQNSCICLAQPASGLLTAASCSLSNQTAVSSAFTAGHDAFLPLR